MGKVIVIGNVSGDFSIFRKLRALQQKQNFDLAIILNLFSNDPDADLKPLLNGEIEVVLPTYFTLGEIKLPAAVQHKLKENDGELCPNLWFAGKRTVTKTSEGLRIVSLGGAPDPEPSNVRSIDEYGHLHTEGDIKSLYGAKTADLLLTSQWAANVQNGSEIKVPEEVVAPKGTDAISRLCVTLKPRYHFSTSSEFFYEREPFFYSDENGGSQPLSFTRFISLADYGNQRKQKYLYAFSIDARDAPTGFPPSTTPCPFAAPTGKRPRAQMSDVVGTGYLEYESHAGSHRKNKKSKQKAPPGPDACFFCLSNPNLATHLITSIGEDAYLTTAKGPLSTSASFPPLNFPGHLLIIPLSHEPTLANIQPIESRESTFAEMTRYRNSLQRLVAGISDRLLGSITWEIARTAGVHAHWQFLPIRAELIEKGLVEAAFQVEAENEHLGVFSPEKHKDDIGPHGDFVRIWIWHSRLEGGTETEEYHAGIGSKILTMSLVEGARFDLQFPRKVMAKLLGLEQRFQWRDCYQSEAEEKEDVTAFKAAFKMFDPAL